MLRAVTLDIPRDYQPLECLWVPPDTFDSALPRASLQEGSLFSRGSCLRLITDWPWPSFILRVSDRQ